MSVLQETRAAGVSKYWYYERALQNYLRGKIPAPDLAAVENEALLLLQRAARDFDPAQGKFRAYLKSNLFFLVRRYWSAQSKQKSKSSRLTGEVLEGYSDPAERPAAADFEAGAAEEDDAELVDALLWRARVAALLNDFLVEELAAEEAAVRRQVQVLMDWLFGGEEGQGLKQAELARRLQVSARQVRTYLSRAANRAALYLQEHLGAEEQEALLTAGELRELFTHYDPKLDESTVEIRNVFRHVSEKKRKVIRGLFEVATC